MVVRVPKPAKKGRWSPLRSRKKAPQGPQISAERSVPLVPIGMRLVAVDQEYLGVQSTVVKLALMVRPPPTDSDPCALSLFVRKPLHGESLDKLRAYVSPMIHSILKAAELEPSADSWKSLCEQLEAPDLVPLYTGYELPVTAAPATVAEPKPAAERQSAQAQAFTDERIAAAEERARVAEEQLKSMEERLKAAEDRANTMETRAKELEARGGGMSKEALEAMTSALTSAMTIPGGGAAEGEGEEDEDEGEEDEEEEEEEGGEVG